MTDPVREALIEEIVAALPCEWDLPPEAVYPQVAAQAIVDALGLVTERKLRILTEEKAAIFPSESGDYWVWGLRGLMPSGGNGAANNLPDAVDAAWRARES